jgi:transposase
VLEGANRKLASVASDVMGVCSRAILSALLAGEADPSRLATLAQGQLRKKRARSWSRRCRASCAHTRRSS